MLQVQFNSQLLGQCNYSDSPLSSIYDSLPPLCKLIIFSASDWVNRHLPMPPPRPQFTVQMFPLNPEAVITCVRAGRQRVLVLKDSKPRVANWDWEGSILPLQLFPIGAKVTHVKMHRKDILDMDLNTFSRVMLFLKVSEASQSQSVLPASLKTVTKQEASHYIVPPLEERTSNFNAHYNHLGSS